ncbi:MAG: DeoR family transcriptional regulator [Sphaerochaeta sp.]|nr:DeoR family transcriptional regulator [Sphaerochaeta sp.]
MFQDQRREKILQLLQENGSCRVLELKELFKVSEPTIRADLESLERTGLITRQHGGHSSTILMHKLSRWTSLHGEGKSKRPGLERRLHPMWAMGTISSLIQVLQSLRCSSILVIAPTST